MINDLYEEAYQYVIQHQKPFNFLHKYYCLIVSPDKLWSDNHKSWIDYSIDKYSQYKHSGFTKEESQVNALLDTIEELLK